MRLACAGVPETWVALRFQAGVRSKGQDHQTGGATLKTRTYFGLEKASCGVEAKRASLQGFESPSPHQYHTHGRSCFSHLQCAEGDFRSISIFDFAFDKHGRLTRNSKLLEGFV